MWKKSEANDSSNRSSDAPNSAPSRPPSAPRMARIGGSLSIKGDLYGEEDLFIEGQIEGKIHVKKGSVTVGERGRVVADIQATNIQVAGVVEGDLAGSDQVVLLETGRVQGNIKAPSVTLQNGARFKGSIDMEGAEDGRKPHPGDAVAGKPNGSSQRVSATPRI